MSDFSTEAQVNAVISDTSLREARRTLEDGLGDTEVQVAAQTDVDGGGSPAGRGLARNRQQLAEQTDQLDENLQLNEERNLLLESLVDASEQGNFNRASGGGGGGGGLLAGGAAVVGGALAGIASTVANFSLSPPDLSPDDVINGPITPDPTDVVAPVSLAASNVVDGVSLTVGDVVGGVSLTVGDVVGGSVTAEQILAAAIATPAGVTVSKLIESKVAVEAGELIKSQAAVEAAELVQKQAEVAAKDLVAEKADVGAGDVIDGSITAEELLAAAAGAGVITGGVAAGASWLRGGAGWPPAAPGAGAGGIGFPAIPVLLGREGARAESQDPEDRNVVEELLADLTPNLGQGRQQRAIAAETGQQIRQSAGGVQRARPTSNETRVEVTTNINGTGGISDREAERIAEEKAEEAAAEIEREIKGR